VASRHHLELINPVVDAALSGAGVELADLDALAVTRGPGLIGALLVGVTTAKALAAATRKPLIGVNHLHGHVAANFLEPEPLQAGAILLACGSAKCGTGDQRMKAACKEPEEKISAAVKLTDQLDAADFRRADLGHEAILVPVTQKNLRQVCG
jgi:tRNA A37 threonylcarbamoyladenosine modification protein TsaB